MALFLIVFIVWGALQVSAVRSSESVDPTAPSIAEVLLPSPTPTMVPSVTPTLQSLLDAAAGEVEALPEQGLEQTQEVLFFSDTLDGQVQVQIVARQRAWMRVTVDGKVEYDGRIIPGTAYGFAGKDVVEIATGNGAGLQVYYNDQDLGILGAYAEVIDFSITVNGVQTPTPTITLTPTQTYTPAGTSTPTPAQTSEPTQTPAP
jgi:hypothetical protein